MRPPERRWIAPGLAAIAMIVAAALGWRWLHRDGPPPEIVAGNGRIEAREIDVASKTPGRLRDVLVDEGDLVKAGQVVARIDTETLRAQQAEATARLEQAMNAIAIAETQLAQRQSERAATAAAVRQRQTELVSAQRRFNRSDTLAREGATPVQERDDDMAAVDSAIAALEAARAQVAAADAAISTARAQVTGARAEAAATRATLRRVEADIADSELKAPRDGRVQFRVAQPGEVVAAGGRVLSMVDLSDVYMTFFLPEQAAGRVALGSEARIVLDAAPDRVIPARIDFVADVAQFTPKTVETQNERQKLTFRVKAQVPPEVLRGRTAYVKTGVPGVAYVRLDPNTPWPRKLQLNVQ